MIWDNTKKLCHIVEIPVPLDTNLQIACIEKERTCMDLISVISQQCKDYKLSLVIITVGGLDSIPKSLKQNLRKLRMEEARIHKATDRIQKAAILRTVKIHKTVFGM